MSSDGRHVYRGWKSTKLGLALIAMGLITIGYGFTGWSEHLYDPFVMGVLAGAAIYTSGNLAEKLRKPGSPPNASP